MSLYKILRQIIGLIFVVILLTGCGGQANPIESAQSTVEPTMLIATPLPPTVIPIQSPTLPSTPQSTIRVMSYNLWFGAGMEPGHTERGSNMNRLADLITLVKQADPDILGFEEANGWEAGKPTIISQFADAVNMKYYLAPTWRGFNLALFSKYPILETENLSDYVGNNGALRAVLQKPDGQKLNVVVAHLDPDNRNLRACEFDKLRQIMDARQDQPSILMGDMNTYPTYWDSKFLTQGGWELVQSETIDNIFVLSQQAWNAKPMCFSSGTSGSDCIADTGISDHKPVGAVISLYDAPNPVVIPISVAVTEVPAVPEMHQIVNVALKGMKGLEGDRFDVQSPCDLSRWDGHGGKSSVADGSLFVRQVSKDDPMGVNRRQAMDNNQAVLLHFRFTGDTNESKFNFYFENGKNGEENYRQYGLAGANNTFFNVTQMDRQNSMDNSQSGTLNLTQGKWYNLLLAEGAAGAFKTVVWDPDNPSQRYELTQPPNKDWARDSWQFGISVYLGQVEVNVFEIYSFDSFQ